MSRCFPYPPPGFEPKLKNEHVDLLHKEKHKEKKHKKEKKDKDKREGKEKREKDKHHSKEKHRDNNEKDKEKKEKKEKHKHKKREKERDKEREKDKTRAQPVPVPVPVPVLVLVPTEKTPEDSRILNEHSRRVGEGSHAGPGSQFTERRVAGNSSYGASEKRPVPVPVQQSVNEAVKVGPTRTVPSASNPNSLVQRKSNNDPTNQVLNHHATGFTERRVAGAAEAKKPVPSSLNPSLQGKTNGPMQNRVAGTDAKRVVGNSKPAAQFTNNHHAAGLTERRVGLNQNVGPASALEKEKGGLNWRGSEPGEGKKEKRKERDEKKDREKELRRQEKKQRKEREKQEKEKKKEKERERVKEEREVGISMTRPSIEGPQRNIEKVGGTDAILSKKRKEGESNGFLHEDEMRAQKLVRTSPPDTVKRKDAFTNGILHENDVGSAKLTKKLPPHPPPPLENGRTSSTTAAINGTTVKAEVPLIKKAPPPQLNGTNPDAKVHHKKKRKEEPPPHPDLKHLDVVYSVPKLSEKELTMPPFDEQEWLFGTKPNHNINPNLNPNSKMREPGSSYGMSQVWDRALRLDSADNSFALPYVVPF